MKSRFFRPNALSTAAVIALAAGSLHAGTVLTLGASTQASQPGPGSDSDPGAGDPSSYVNSNSYQSSQTGRANAYSFANGAGAYAVSSDAEGATAAASANAFLRYAIFNDSGFAQSYSATFKIYGGSISTNLANGATLTTAEYLRASYMALITRDASTLFTSSATIEQTSNGAMLDLAGTVLNDLDDGADGYYGWDSRYVTLDLGILGDGEGMELLASLMQSSTTNVGTYDFGGGSGYDGYCGYQGYASFALSETSCTGFKGSAYGFYGDPLEFDEVNQFVITSRAVNGVPEPGSLALMFTALGAAAAVRRKRKVLS